MSTTLIQAQPTAIKGASSVSSPSTLSSTKKTGTSEVSGTPSPSSAKGTPFKEVLTQSNSRGTKTEKVAGKSMTQPASNLENKLSELIAQIKQFQNQLNSQSASQTSDNDALKKQLASLLGLIDSKPNQQSSTKLLSKDGLHALSKLMEGLKNTKDVKSDPTSQGDIWSQLIAALQQLQTELKAITTSSVKSGPKSITRIQTNPFLSSTQKSGSNQSGKTDAAPSLTTSSISSQATKGDPSKTVLSFNLKSDSHSLGNGSKEQLNSGLLSVEKPKQDTSNVSIGSLIGVTKDMGKVQQLLFHNSNTATQPNTATQIENQIKTWLSQGALKANNGQLSMNLQLHPENLGTVQLQINQTDGGLTASITAHSAMTKDLLDSQLSHLQQSLAGSGISIQKLEVMLAPTAQQTSNPSYQQPQDQSGANQYTNQRSSQQDDKAENDSFENWLQSEGISV